MLHVAWNVFKHSGSIETYLLLKDLENETQAGENSTNDESFVEFDAPIS